MHLPHLDTHFMDWTEGDVAEYSAAADLVKNELPDLDPEPRRLALHLWHRFEEKVAREASAEACLNPGETPTLIQQLNVNIHTFAQTVLDPSREQERPLQLERLRQLFTEACACEGLRPDCIPDEAAAAVRSRVEEGLGKLHAKPGKSVELGFRCAELSDLLAYLWRREVGASEAEAVPPGTAGAHGIRTKADRERLAARLIKQITEQPELLALSVEEFARATKTAHKSVYRWRDKPPGYFSEALSKAIVKIGRAEIDRRRSDLPASARDGATMNELLGE